MLQHGERGLHAHRVAAAIGELLEHRRRDALRARRVWPWNVQVVSRAWTGRRSRRERTPRRRASPRRGRARERATPLHRAQYRRRWPRARGSKAGLPRTTPATLNGVHTAPPEHRIGRRRANRDLARDAALRAVRAGERAPSLVAAHRMARPFRLRNRPGLTRSPRSQPDRCAAGERNPVIGHAAPAAWQVELPVAVAGASQHSWPALQWMAPQRRTGSRRRRRSRGEATGSCRNRGRRRRRCSSGNRWRRSRTRLRSRGKTRRSTCPSSGTRWPRRTRRRRESRCTCRTVLGVTRARAEVLAVHAGARVQTLVRVAAVRSCRSGGRCWSLTGCSRQRRESARIEPTAAHSHLACSSEE